MTMQSAHAGLLGDGVLRRYSRCPLCSSEGRTEVEHDFAPNKYLVQFQELDRRLDLEALRSLPTYQCTTCSTHYCDPWFSAAFSAKFFNSGFAQHGYGWGRLYKTIDPRKRDPLEEHQLKLWTYVSKLGTVDSYAEVNCPFTGLLPFFRKRELGERHVYSSYEANVRSIRSASVYPTSFEPYVSVLKRLGAYLPHRSNKPVREAVIEAFPKTRYLIRETTSLFWGGNCMAREATCSGVSGGFLKAAPIDFKDVAREGITLDVLGLYNCLDHFFEPMRVLRTAVESSRNVIVIGHKYSQLSKQHQFCLGADFGDYLRSLGWTVSDITSEVLSTAQMENNCALCISGR